MITAICFITYICVYIALVTFILSSASAKRFASAAASVLDLVGVPPPLLLYRHAAVRKRPTTRNLNIREASARTLFYPSQKLMFFLM